MAFPAQGNAVRDLGRAAIGEPSCMMSVPFDAKLIATPRAPAIRYEIQVPFLLVAKESLDFV